MSLNQIRAELAAATPGPWEALTDPGDHKTAPAWIVDADEIEIRLPGTYAAGKVATLIANAPTHLAALLGAVDAALKACATEYTAYEDGRPSTVSCDRIVAAIHQHLGGEG